MKIDQDRIENLLKLSKLNCTQDEKIQFKKDLEGILKLIDELKEEKIEDRNLDQENGYASLREDEVKVFDDLETLFKHTNHKEDKGIVIPKMME